MNRLRVLEALRAGGPASRAELARRTQVSKVTVAKVVTDLTEAGLLRARSDGGTLFELSDDAGFATGGHIAADTSRLRIVDMVGRVRTEEEFRTPRTLENFIARVNRAQASLLRRGGIPAHRLRAACVALPASLGPDGISRNAGRPRYLEGARLGGLLLPGHPLELVNDVDMAALAERDQGSAGAWAHFAYIGVTPSGVGMGLVLDGHLYRGSKGRAGEIGQLPLSDHEGVLEIAMNWHDTGRVAELGRVVATSIVLLDLEGVVVHTDLGDPGELAAGLSEALVEWLREPVPVIEGSLGGDASILGAQGRALSNAWRILEHEASFGA